MISCGRPSFEHEHKTGSGAAGVAAPTNNRQSTSPFSDLKRDLSLCLSLSLSLSLDIYIYIYIHT